MGLAVADELTRRGIQVEMFERNPAAAVEASAAAAGILDPCGEAEGPSPFLELLRASYPLIPGLVQRLESAAGLRLGFQVCGMMAVALTGQEAEHQEREFSWQSNQTDDR